MHQSIPSILSALSRMNQMMDLYSTKNTSRSIYQRLENICMKGDCTKRKNKRQPCPECKLNEWISPPMNRIPPPRPDETKLPDYHYKDVFESSSGTDACHHPPDDWQPRHNIKKCFDDGTLLGDDDAISSFSTIFIVEKELIKDHLQHLTTLERKKTCAQRTGWRNASRDNRNASRTMIEHPLSHR